MRQTGSGDLLTKCWAGTEFPEVTEKRTFNQPLSAVARHTHRGEGMKKELQELLVGGLTSTTCLKSNFCSGKTA